MSTFPENQPAMTEDPTSVLGSSSWIGTGGYEPSGEFDQRATEFLTAVKWDALGSISSGLRHDIPCSFSDKFSIGHFNMVRRIVFTDGVSWVARVRLPELKAVFGERERLDVASTLKVEIASMKTKTSVPVPEVHSYSVDPTNEVGAPYILMDYIHGTVATELQDSKKCEPGLFGTPDQDRKFRQQMASIQATLSSFTFSQIRSLYHDEKTSSFSIGPDLETGKGPWTSPTDYFDLTTHALQVCARDADPSVQTSPSFALPILFKHLISLYPSCSTTNGPFRLTNRDFGAHNLLVNDTFDIVGVIDLDGVMAAPIELAAQYPVLTGLDREPPGHVETIPAAIERIKRTEPKLEEYRDMVEAAEARMGISSEGQSPIGSLMLSDGTSVLQGLLRYGSHQKFVNDKWMEAYVKLLRGHIVSEGQRMS